MRVIIMHPDLRLLGGIETYCEKLSKLYTFPVDHFIVGKRPGEVGLIKLITRLIKDYVAFIALLNTHEADVVHVNPSLEFKSFFREGLFVKLAQFKGRKTVTFFHGWDPSFADKLERYGLWLFKFLYGNTGSFIVLSEGYSQTIKSWGCTQPIYVESTTVGDDSLNGFEITEAINARLSSKSWRLFFISRIFKKKGVFETIEIFNILKKTHTNLELVIAGDGIDLENAKAYVQKKSIPDVIFTGDIRGKAKDAMYKEAHILCFPTYHNEGLPSCVVEAMAFGLPVITRPVGGLADFFINGEHGYITNSKDPYVFADLIEKLILDKDKYIQISTQNFLYAQKRFLATQAVLRLEKIYNSILISDGGGCD